MTTMVNTVSFEMYTPENAPVNSKAALDRLKQSVGAIPNLAATMAGSGALIEGFVTLREIVNKTVGFSPEERELIFLANATANECNYCMAIHSAFGQKAGLPSQTLEAVRFGTPLSDPRKNAIVNFTKAIAVKRGKVSATDLKAFLDAGFEKSHALDLIACFAQSVMANYTNHIAHVELDEFLKG